MALSKKFKKELDTARETTDRMIEMQNEFLRDMGIVSDLLKICQTFIEKWKRRGYTNGGI